MGNASSGTKEHGCQMCKLGAKIQWHCQDCNIYLCDRCEYTDHKKFGAHHNITRENKSSSIQEAQAPVVCQICNKETTIQWRCEDCNLWVCDGCNSIDHQQYGKHHKVIHIKDIGGKASSEMSKAGDSNNKTSEFDKIRKHENKLRIKVKVIAQYTVDTKNIHDMAVSPDECMWIGDNTSEKILHIKISGDRVIVLATFNIKPFSLAISPSGSPFVVREFPSILIIINEIGKTIDSKQYSIDPWILSSIHVTRDQNIIAGGHDDEGHGVVNVMGKNGKNLAIYGKENDRLLTYPRNIATTNNGNIFVGDGIHSLKRGKVVVIKPESGDTKYHNGHPAINTNDKPFDPISILVTPRDNVIIMDYNTDYIHILDNEGDFISYYNLKDIGVIRPFCLALSPSGNIYIGCASSVKDLKNTKAKLYTLEYSGV